MAAPIAALEPGCAGGGGCTERPQRSGGVRASRRALASARRPVRSGLQVDAWCGGEVKRGWRCRWATRRETALAPAEWSLWRQRL